MKLKDLLPLLRDSCFSYKDKGDEIYLAPDPKKWTWILVNLNSRFLDDLGDYFVTDIDCVDGNIRLWVNMEVQP
jgi:hypothetical protein